MGRGSSQSPSTNTTSTGISWEPLRQLAFQPWSPVLLSAIKEGKLLAPSAVLRDGIPVGFPSYLHTGPPVLLNPERVVPYSESERYERHFTPNVSLAPSSSKALVDDEDDDLKYERHFTPNVSLTPTSSKALVDEEDEGDKAVTAKTADANKAAVAVLTDRRDSELREYDLPTDTDESSMASPTDSGCPPEPRFPDTPAYESTLEKELEMVRLALYDKVEPTPEARSRFMHEFSKMRAKSEELMLNLLRTNACLKSDLESVQREKLELQSRLVKVERDLERLQIDGDFTRHIKQETQD